MAPQSGAAVAITNGRRTLDPESVFSANISPPQPKQCLQSRIPVPDFSYGSMQIRRLLIVGGFAGGNWFPDLGEPSAPPIRAGRSH